MPRPPRSLAILVVLAVVVAGCSAGGGGPPGTDEPGTPTETAAATETPTAPEGPPYDTPLDSETVLRAHEAAIGAAGSYTFDTELSVTEEGTNASVYERWHVEGDLVDDRIYLERNSTVSENRTVYADGVGEGYEPTVINGKQVYQRPDDWLTDPWRFATPEMAQFLDGIDFTDEGTTTRDGETAYVYTARGASQFDEELLDLPYYRNGTIRNATATLVIAESGAIRSFDYRIDGTDAEGDTIVYAAPLSYERVGDTPVQEPAWLDEARAELDGD